MEWVLISKLYLLKFNKLFDEGKTQKSTRVKTVGLFYFQWYWLTVIMQYQGLFSNWQTFLIFKM